MQPHTISICNKPSVEAWNHQKLFAMNVEEQLNRENDDMDAFVRLFKLWQQLNIANP